MYCNHLFLPDKMYKLPVGGKKNPNTNFQILTSIKKYVDRIILVCVGIALVGSVFLYNKNLSSLRTFSPLPSLSALITSDPASKTSSPQENHLEDLPIGKITTHKAEQEWGTAILIPQYHRYPGTESKDSINNSAKEAQEQIYEILPHIQEQYGTDLVMVEGELYGQVSAEKLESINKKITERNELSAEHQRLVNLLKKDGFNAEEERCVKNFDRAIAEINRDITLNGAPFKLKAEGKNIIIFGAENQSTREESKKLVKNYIYLQDREKQLRGYHPERLSFRDNQSNKLFSSDLKLLLSKLLKSRSSKDILMNDLKKLKITAESNNNKELLRIIRDIEQTLRKSNNNTAVSGRMLATQSTQSREENPYRNVNSPDKIERMLQETEQKIDEIIVDKRNQETAENFANMLREKKGQNGIIQFGAGHEQGLIQELNKRGISVMVITPSEVLKRNLESNSVR